MHTLHKSHENGTGEREREKALHGAAAATVSSELVSHVPLHTWSPDRRRSHAHRARASTLEAKSMGDLPTLHAACLTGGRGDHQSIKITSASQNEGNCFENGNTTFSVL